MCDRPQGSELGLHVFIITKQGPITSPPYDIHDIKASIVLLSTVALVIGCFLTGITSRLPEVTDSPHQRQVLPPEPAARIDTVL